MDPIELVIPRRPVSQQARRQDRLRSWKELVAQHARAALRQDHELATTPISVTVLYVYDEVALDVDNVAKPILDTLKNLVFKDDSLVTDLEVRKRTRGTLNLAGAAPLSLTPSIAILSSCT